MPDSSLLADYRSGVQILKAAIAGLSADEWDARPGPGDWSIQEVVCHLADSEVLFAERMKRVIVEERPELAYADAAMFVNALACQSRQLEDEVELIAAVRRQMSCILEAQPDMAWGRVGIHSRQGEQTLEQLVRKAVDHLEHHVEFIRRKRDAMRLRA